MSEKLGQHFQAKKNSKNSRLKHHWASKFQDAIGIGTEVWVPGT